MWGAGQVLLGRGAPVVSGVPPDGAGGVFLWEKPMEFQHGHRDRGSRFPVLPSPWNWGSPAPPRICWRWIEFGSLWDVAGGLESHPKQGYNPILNWSGIPS